MPNSIPRSRLSVEVADLIGAASRRVRRWANDDLEPLGLTASQARALRAIGRERRWRAYRDPGRPLAMGDLAEELGIVARSATSIVDELETKHLVQREHDWSDRRRVVVELTPAGRELLAALRRRRDAAAVAVTEPLSSDELASLRDLLAKLA